MSADPTSAVGRAPSRVPLSPLLGVRIIQSLLWLLVLAAPVVAVVALIEVSALRNHIDEVSVPPEVSVDTSPAEGAAELAVFDHLDSPTGSNGARWRVAGITSLGAVELAPGYMAVTVAAHLTPVPALNPDIDTVTDSAPGPARRLVFTVGLVETDAGWTPVGVPSLVAAPTVAPVEAAAGGRRLDDTTGLAESVTRFLSAYLTGDGELARYTAPGSRLVAVSPPPFLTVEVTQAGSTERADGSRLVSVQATGVDAAGGELAVGYWLVVAERDGRWEVTDLLAAPPPESLPLSTEGGS